MNEFAPIIGYKATVEELERISDSLKCPERYRQLGATTPRGLVLYGKPGTGKTTMAECFIKASGRPAYTCRRTEADDTFIEKMKGIFEKAEQNAPSLVFLDDMDKFANSDNEHRDDPIFVTVQSCIDNLRGKEVFVLATANENIKNLPSSLLRPGRFDRRIFVDAPEGEDAVRIIEKYLANKKIADDLDPSLIAAILRNRSCAELETVVNEAATIAAYNGCEVVAAEHMVEASMRAVFHIPAECLYDTDPVNLNTDSEKSLVVWHEAGHTLMNELLKPGSVALVSAKSKQSSHSGFTVTSLHEVHNGYRKIIYDILIDLGGKAAVDVVFGLPETGVRDDMSTATESLFKLISTVNSHGFYLHRHYYDPWDGDSFLDSDATAHDRQVAAAILLEDYYGKVKRTLIANRMLLWKIAHALAEKSYLTAKDLAELMKGETLVKPEL